MKVLFIMVVVFAILVNLVAFILEKKLKRKMQKIAKEKENK